MTNEIRPADTVNSRQLTSPGRGWLWGLILILAVITTYSPVWRAGFIWDDHVLLTDNPCIVGPLGLKEIWTTKAAWAFICPLTLTTFWAEHALWGLNPLPYHLVNVLMHGLNAIVLWRVLRALRIPGAWLGSALWALHPVQVESVAWIAEMKNTQSGLFYLLTILFFVKWLRAEECDKDRRWNYGLTLLFSALAITSKTPTVVLPLVLGLCAWWVEGGWKWRTLAGIIPVVLMSMAGFVVSIWAVGPHPANISDPRVIYSPQGSLAAAGGAIWFYLVKLAWPHPLMAIYPLLGLDAGQPLSYLPLLGAVVVLFISWHKRDSGARPYFFAYAYFLVAMLPELQLADSYVADHYQYLASMGPLALAGAGLMQIADVSFLKKSWLRAGLCAGFIVLLGVLSWQRAWAYESAETFWKNALAKNPNSWVAQLNFGNVLLQEKRYAEALVYLNHAADLDPVYGDIHLNLGIALEKLSRIPEAEVQYRKAISLNPGNSNNYLNLGEMLRRHGNVAEAEAQFREGLKIDPDNESLCINLGGILLESGRTAEAISVYEKALALNPKFPQLQYNLGVALLQTGDIPKAADHLATAVELDPKLAPAHESLGVALARAHHFPEAIEEFRAALANGPDSAEARDNLALALAQSGNIPAAIEQFKKALELDPNDAKARDGVTKLQR